MRSELLALAAALLLSPIAPLPSASAGAGAPDGSADTPDGGVIETVEDALKAAFPGAKVERERHLLSKEQRAAVAKASGDADFDRRVGFAYVARDAEGREVGTAYFDAHRVRTKRETLMVVVRPDRALQEVRVLAFLEPREYLPGARWYGQFAGRKLGPDLRLKGAIDVCTGATITSRVTTEAARRSLALHDVLYPAPAPPPPVPPGDGSPTSEGGEEGGR